MTKITDVRGIGPAAAISLASRGFGQLEALANAGVAEVATVRGFTEERAAAVIADAKALLGKRIPVKKAPSKPRVSPAAGISPKAKKQPQPASLTASEPPKPGQPRSDAQAKIEKNGDEDKKAKGKKDKGRKGKGDKKKDRKTGGDKSKKKK